MQLPFSIDAFLNVFKVYNESIFPLQIIFNLAALIIIVFLFKQTKNGDRFINLLLLFFWIWIGAVYHILFFTGINPAAYIFGGLFILQGIIFFIYGYLLKLQTFKFNNSINNYTGILFFIYALIIYPLFGHFSGHQYPYSPTFGLPCPTTIFTFGVLLFMDKKIPLTVLIIPFLWSLLGFSAALNLGIYEDIGLIVAGILGTGLMVLYNKKQSYITRTV
jgi:hypothetical protein